MFPGTRQLAGSDEVMTNDDQDPCARFGDPVTQQHGGSFLGQHLVGTSFAAVFPGTRPRAKSDGVQSAVGKDQVPGDVVSVPTHQDSTNVTFVGKDRAVTCIQNNPQFVYTQSQT